MDQAIDRPKPSVTRRDHTTGYIHAGYEAWSLVIGGVLKILYDLALLWAYRHIRPPEE